MNDSPLIFNHVVSAIIAASLGVLVVVIGSARRIRLPRVATVFALLAIVLLTAAAGQPIWRRATTAEVAVMVDCSPTTRGAAYRDRAALEVRIHQLLGNTPFRIYRFASGVPIADSATPFDDLPADATRFSPPPAAAVLLFSDGQFPLPASAPPVYAVIDPNLTKAIDARVTSLSEQAGEAIAGVESNARSRMLVWAEPRLMSSPVSSGAYLLRHPIDGQRKNAAISARLSPGDAWPENDELTLTPQPPQLLVQWYVTEGSIAPRGFVLIHPRDLPNDPAAYLSASAIVLENIPAFHLSSAHQELLAQYVRDLGGGLILLGGDRAFAAGSYAGTPIESVSPLASTPPAPAMRWTLLTDSSGSMNSDADGRAGGPTRWQVAVNALVKVLPGLPPQDPVDIGSFAATVTWWSSNRSADATRRLSLPPLTVSPSGPTDLRPAIEAAVARQDAALPGHLLLLTDADAVVGDIPSLVALLRSRKISLHLLAIGQGSGLADLTQVVKQTGGRLVHQDNAGKWAEAAEELMRAALAENAISHSPVTARFSATLGSLPSRDLPLWNRTWLKPTATVHASGESEGLPVTLAASWQVGEGRVAAAGFTPSGRELLALVEPIARPPNDPRLKVEWLPGRQFKVRVDATGISATGGATGYLNGRTFSVTLPLGDRRSEAYALVQTGPGQYEGEFAAPRQPGIAILREEGRIVAQCAVAGRYPPEFDAIGIDRKSLDTLARQSHGGVIELTDSRPIDFHGSRKSVEITGWFIAAAATLLAASLLWWRFASA